ncbi:MAG TPA: L,D-transpeptidase [Flavobacterium sp.]|nr:L,D-transpeptidase [Flavobacterium sp.]
MKKTLYPILLLASALLLSCRDKEVPAIPTPAEEHQVSEQAEQAKATPVVTAADINLKKELAYDKYTLEDSYAYKDTVRVFQWEKIKEKLAFVENFSNQKGKYIVLQNYKNKNGESPTVKNYVRNAYTRVSDSLGVERYQSAPLYKTDQTELPSFYGRDGWLGRLISSDTLDMIRLQGISFNGTWDVPKRYVKTLSDSIAFNFIVVVDVTNQNITTLERADNQWLIRSMNPATSGVHQPPYAHETPPGMFIMQEKKEKMFFHKDGTTEIGGYAPYASRFTNGAYIHGVPVNYPQQNIIEYSYSLGTTPRSHMCVRNVSSHAKFIYDRVKPYEILVFIID